MSRTAWPTRNRRQTYFSIVQARRRVNLVVNLIHRVNLIRPPPSNYIISLHHHNRDEELVETDAIIVTSTQSRFRGQAGKEEKGPRRRRRKKRTGKKGRHLPRVLTSSQDVAFRRSKIAIPSGCNSSHIYHDTLKHQTWRHSKYP